MKLSLRFLLCALILCALLAPASLADRGPVTLTSPADVALQRQFAALWEQRFTRDMSLELLPFLDAPDPELAQRTVRALGRLENPDALPELQKRADEQKAAIEAGKDDPSKRPKRYLTFDTAIARIQSHDLHGREKIEFVLKRMPITWTWGQAIEWSQKVSDPKNYLLDSPQAVQVRELVDFLYSMSKMGEDIEVLRKQFSFSKAQNVQLDGAKLPLAEEAEHLLDYSQTLDIVGFDDEYICESFLLSLGEPARVALEKRLKLLLETKPPFANRFPFDCMLRAAGMTGDQKFLPLVTRFFEEMRYVRYGADIAQQSQRHLKDNNAFSFAPQ